MLNVGHAHVGEFGGREAIAQAKGELVEALSSDGVAVLNATDPRVWAMRPRTSARVLPFAVEAVPEGSEAVWADDLAGDDLLDELTDDDMDDAELDDDVAPGNAPRARGGAQ